MKLFTSDKNAKISLKCILTKLKFLRQAVLKILQFKINTFTLTSVLPFCHYCDRRSTFEKQVYIYRKAANFIVVNL